MRLYPEEGPPVKVNLTNGDIDGVSVVHLYQHSCVGEGNLDLHLEEDEEYWEDDDLGLLMSSWMAKIQII